MMVPFNPNVLHCNVEGPMDGPSLIHPRTTSNGLVCADGGKVPETEGINVK
jgi:hypothetical protein